MKALNTIKNSFFDCQKQHKTMFIKCKYKVIELQMCIFVIKNIFLAIGNTVLLKTMCSGSPPNAVSYIYVIKNILDCFAL